jgi:ubiquinone/menaquinone biosynthesis C-methylase UbiE
MDDLRILDDGTGKGIIAKGLIKRGLIFGIDRTSIFLAKSKKKDLEQPEFLIAVGEYLPFRPDSFHVIISQMVLEHVFNVRKYLEEVYFVLKEKGFFYLAFPNRFFPIEPHTHIPIIPYLPHRIFQRIINTIKGENYPLNYLSYKILNIILKIGFKRVRDLVPNFLKNPKLYYPSVPLSLCRGLAKFYGLTRFFIPTWIWLLEKN